MDYTASQYSVIAHMVTDILFQVYILRPDGSELLRLNGGWMGSVSDFWENKRYANIIADELNGLLVIPPQCEMCIEPKLTKNKSGLCDDCQDELEEEAQAQLDEDMREYNAMIMRGL